MTTIFSFITLTLLSFKGITKSVFKKQDYEMFRRTKESGNVHSDILILQINYF